MKIMTEADIGSCVTYVPYNGCPKSKWENGIVKSYSNENKLAFVVYHCHNDWDHYFRYTGESTVYEDLLRGWKEEL